MSQSESSPQPSLYLSSLLKIVRGTNDIALGTCLLSEANKYRQTHPLQPNNINTSIIKIMQDIIQNKLQIDVAFCRLLVLIDYTHCIWKAYTSQYVLFLAYFSIASSLSKAHRANISMRNILNIDAFNTAMVGKSVILHHLMNRYLPHLDATCTRFKYLVDMKEVISCSVQGYIGNDVLYESRIGCVIAEFVQYESYEFVYVINQWMMSCRGDIWRSFADNFDYWHDYPAPLPRLLLSDRFIQHGDDRLKLEAFHLAFNLAAARPNLIGKFFECFKSTCCYCEPPLFVELLERHLHQNIMQSIKQAVMQSKLTIFYHGNDTNYDYIHYDKLYYDDKHYQLMSKNVTFIFGDIINKYFRNDEDLMHNALYQLLNSVIHYMSIKRDNTPYKQQFITQLLEHKEEECVKYHLKNTKFVNALNVAKRLQNHL